MSEFNTAIFYDTENLIGGYGRLNMVSFLSLKKIYSKITKKNIGKIAIQRAYANWSDQRLNILKSEIIELGIEPIQMFGFGNGPQKNASDIQLVIDAMDVAFTRKNIKIFIIVSGDGGFASLAKKLHEYGYMVIGCAFKKTTNKVFEAVCDDFIWIEEPKEKQKKEKIIPTKITTPKESTIEETKSKFKNPIFNEYAKKFNPKEFKKDEIVKEAVKILNVLSLNKETASILKKEGLNISIFNTILKYRINNFNISEIGFKKFLEFLKVVTKNNKSRVKLIHHSPNIYKLVFKHISIDGFEDV